MENNICVGIDIGTTKVTALVAKKLEEGKLEIIAVGKAPSYGVVRGQVQNVRQTQEAIEKAVSMAEASSGQTIDEVYVGIAGSHIRSSQQMHVINMQEPNTDITEDEVQRLTREMYNTAVGPDERIIHVLPQEYTIDGQTNILEPVGCMGSRLSANFHVITGKIQAAKMIEESIKRAGLTLKNLVLEPIASSAAVLSEKEKEAGVVLVDIGGGTTDIAIFHKNVIRHSAVIPFGGQVITNDIQHGCHILEDQAEKLKTKFGVAISVDSTKHQVVSIPRVNGGQPRQISVQTLSEIIKCRMGEIFELVDMEIRASGYHGKLLAGIVLTGGGSKLRHISQLAEYVTGIDTRVGEPIERLANNFDAELRHPLFATGIGLCEMGFRFEQTLGKSAKPAVLSKLLGGLSGMNLKEILLGGPEHEDFN